MANTPGADARPKKKSVKSSLLKSAAATLVTVPSISDPTFHAFARPIEIRKTDEDDVEVAVVIEVDERAGRGQKAIRRQAALRRDVGKAAAAVVVQQEIAAVPNHEQIRKAVVVVVAGNRSDGAGTKQAADARFTRDVGARAAVVTH